MFRALWLLLESIVVLLSLSVQSKIRKVKTMLKKQKAETEKFQKPSPSSAPVLSIKKTTTTKAKPPFPVQKGIPKSQSPEKEKGSLKIGLSSVDAELGEISQRDIRTAGAALDLPFRAVNLIWKDVPALTKEELEYLSEPLAEILIELDWMDKLKGPYLKLGWGLSVAIVSRARAHELVKAERKKAEATAKVGDKAAAGAPEKTAGAMAPGRS